jgi:deazaflavin-dependent oxidoreductase (nitroreductase family)
VIWKERKNFMTKTYRVTPFVRLSNIFATTLLRVGVKPGNMVLLTIRGRKSGLPRTTPVVLIEQDGRRWLIGPFGEVNWVRNLRAAGEATITRGRRSEAISVDELSPEEAAPILKQSLTRAPALIRQYFDVTPASPIEDFVREAPRHPVFLVHPAVEKQSRTEPANAMRRSNT